MYKMTNTNTQSPVWRHIFEDFNPDHGNWLVSGTYAEQLHNHSDKVIPLDVCEAIEKRFNNVYDNEWTVDEEFLEFIDDLQGIEWGYEGEHAYHDVIYRDCDACAFYKN